MKEFIYSKPLLQSKTPIEKAIIINSISFYERFQAPRTVRSRLTRKRKLPDIPDSIKKTEMPKSPFAISNYRCL